MADFMNVWGLLQADRSGAHDCHWAATALVVELSYWLTFGVCPLERDALRAELARSGR